MGETLTLHGESGQKATRHTVGEYGMERDKSGVGVNVLQQRVVCACLDGAREGEAGL